MEVQVEVTKILEPQSFTSKNNGNTYTRYSFLGMTIESYPRLIYFQTLGEDKFHAMNIQQGNVYNVSFDIESRMFNDRYYTSINAWKAEKVEGVQPQSQVQQAQPQQPSYYPQQPQQQPNYGYQAPTPAPAPMPNYNQSGQEPPF